MLKCLERLRAQDEIFTITFGAGPSSHLLVCGTFKGDVIVWDTGTRVTYSNARLVDGLRGLGDLDDEGEVHDEQAVQ